MSIGRVQNRQARDRATQEIIFLGRRQKVHLRSLTILMFCFDCSRIGWPAEFCIVYVCVAIKSNDKVIFFII